jgi:transcriptional regulator with XRE-family HTH domain
MAFDERRTQPSLPKSTTKHIAALADRLAAALEARRPPMSRGQLAAKLGVSAGAVSHWLNGNRPCPEAVVLKIAKLTKAEPGWLIHGAKAPADIARPTPNGRAAVRNLVWGFRQAPADGGKDFGNAAVYATPMTVRTIVREDGQNSLDAGRSDEVVLRFRLVELSPTSTRYTRVLNALGFEDLRGRVRSIEEADEYESKLGTKLSAGMEAVLGEKLVLLYVDDYRTRGLQGDEFDSTKPYCALVRDNLNSRKDTNTAGGVFGVGSKVNLACSRLSTVIFASKVAGEESRGTRIVGRSELTYHELKVGGKKQQFAGPGWLGIPGDRAGVMESAWLPDDATLLDDLMLRRDRLPAGVRKSEATGTSILIVGFTDPQTEAGATTQQLADSFVEAAAVNFWPAMMRGSLTVIVERYVDDAEEPIKSEHVDPRSVAGVNELCDAYEKQVSGATTPALINPGDVASIVVSLTVPATRQRAKGIRAHEELTAECRLLVRLADPDSGSSDPRVGQVAYMRGRAMVVRYQPRASVVGGRPFHAVLLAGTMAGRANEQVAAEQFLRIAEPPAHDKWAYSSDLGERYARGAKKSLDDFHSRVTEELQRALRPPISRQSEGPEILRRLLLIRPPAQDPVPAQPQVRITRRKARVVDGAWEVEAELSINPTPRALVVTPRLSFRCEGGAPIPVRWSHIEVEDGSAVTVEDGALLLPPRTKRVAFKGRSDLQSHPVPAEQSSAVLDVLARVEVAQ